MAEASISAIIYWRRGAKSSAFMVASLHSKRRGTNSSDIHARPARPPRAGVGRSVTPVRSIIWRSTGNQGASPAPSLALGAAPPRAGISVNRTYLGAALHYRPQHVVNAGRGRRQHLGPGDPDRRGHAGAGVRVMERIASRDELDPTGLRAIASRSRPPSLTSSYP